MDGMGDDDRLGDDTPSDRRHESAHDDPTNDFGPTDLSSPNHGLAGDGPDGTGSENLIEPDWDDRDDDEAFDDEPFDAELLLLLEHIDWEQCDADLDDADCVAGARAGGASDPLDAPSPDGWPIADDGCTAAMAEILHPSSLSLPTPPLGGSPSSGPSSAGGSRPPQRPGTNNAGAIVPILCAVAGVFVMVAIVQLIPGEWPFWRAAHANSASQATSSTLQPHPATFSLVTGSESRTAVLTSPAGLLATISPLRPAASVTVTHQLWVDKATLLAWDQRSGVAVYEISSNHPVPTIADTAPAGGGAWAPVDQAFDTDVDEVQVACDGACPADPGAPVQRGGTLVGLVALEESASETRRSAEDDKVVTIPLDRLQEIADELVRASGG